MGNGMNKVLHGLYVGNFSDSRDKVQLAENGITHIVSIHDNAKPAFPDKRYLCIEAEDRPDVQLLAHFCSTSEFIHKARLAGGTVLVHCLAGVSRSVTIATAYIMVATDLSWKEALNAVRGARRCANPNLGFQKQLQDWEHRYLRAFKSALYSKHPRMTTVDDHGECKRLAEIHRLWVLNGDASATAAQDSHPTYPLRHGAYASSPTPASTVARSGSGGPRKPSPPDAAAGSDSPSSESAASSEEAAAAAAGGAARSAPPRLAPASSASGERSGCEPAEPLALVDACLPEEVSVASDWAASESCRAVTVRINELEDWD